VLNRIVIWFGWAHTPSSQQTCDVSPLRSEEEPDIRPSQQSARGNESMPDVEWDERKGTCVCAGEVAPGNQSIPDVEWDDEEGTYVWVNKVSPEPVSLVEKWATGDNKEASHLPQIQPDRQDIHEEQAQAPRSYHNSAARLDLPESPTLRIPPVPMWYQGGSNEDIYGSYEPQNTHANIPLLPSIPSSPESPSDIASRIDRSQPFSPAFHRLLNDLRIIQLRAAKITCSRLILWAVNRHVNLTAQTTSS
jgi:hypothetical protein